MRLFDGLDLFDVLHMDFIGSDRRIETNVLSTPLTPPGVLHVEEAQDNGGGLDFPLRTGQLAA